MEAGIGKGVRRGERGRFTADPGDYGNMSGSSFCQHTANQGKIQSFTAHDRPPAQRLAMAVTALGGILRRSSPRVSQWRYSLKTVR